MLSVLSFAGSISLRYAAVVDRKHNFNIAACFVMGKNEDKVILKSKRVIVCMSDVYFP